MRYVLYSILAVGVLATGLLVIDGNIALAMQPPEPGMLAQMEAEGTLGDALRFAEELGNHEMRAPLRGAPLGTDDPYTIAGMIADHFGRSMRDKSTSAIASSTPQELGWLELDLNHDGTVDERDVLALGVPQPKEAALFPSLGTVKTFALLIEYSDYEHWFPKSEFETNLFADGSGTSGYDYYPAYYRTLKYYYDQASYGLLNVDGDVFGWYECIHPRTYYHPNDNSSNPWDGERRSEMIREALLDADANGADFSDYDNDGDGDVDYFLVVYTGPVGAWSSFWWGYYGVSVGSDFVLDGVTFPTYSFQWEQYYGFTGSPPNPADWDPKVTIHETGHSLGLPDYYDYQSGVGPDGGVGGLDMMHGNWGDHNCFSKYALGWLNPTVAFTNLDDEQLDKSNANADAVVFMPGFDPVSPWSEFFMAQNRYKEGIDSTYPTSGLLLWHVDARVNSYGRYIYDNSYTSHKLLRLMEADGLEEIEQNKSADAGDYYDDTSSTGDDLTPTSTPDSTKYDGTDLGIYCDDVSVAGASMTADFTMFTSNPPTVEITDPDAGDTITGTETIAITATDDNAVELVQLLIDGVLVAEWTATPYTYSWNSLVEFNKSLTLEARGWDAEGQTGSDTISVTVSNTGVTSVTDDFESGLGKWRALHEPTDPNGVYIGGVGYYGLGSETFWTTRTSPGTPTPLGSGDEAWVSAPEVDVYYNAMEHLRSQRINATSFTDPIQVKFYYRATGDFSLWATTDQGDTWERLAEIDGSSSWTTFRGVYDFTGETVYLRLFYYGDFQLDENNGLSLSIDDLLIREAPSDPPTVSFTSHDDGDTVSGNETFAASASDDSSVEAVWFYLNGSLVKADDSSPYSFTRNTLNDDNYPSIPIKAIALDDDDLVSEPAEIAVVFKNPRDYPVYDDLESGTDDWTIDNDSKTPNWALIDDADDAYSGSHCWGWVGSVTADGNNDKAYYLGFEPDSGLQTIDLSGDSLDDPVVRFMYRSDVPGDAGLRVRTVSTWEGTRTIGWVTGDSDGWEEYFIPLNQYVGQSVQILFRMYNQNDNGGTGFWLDDVRVENRYPTILEIDPDRATVGTEITISGMTFGFERGTSKVTFADGVDAASGDYSSWDNEEIVLDIPADAESGDVTVTVGDDTGAGYHLTIVLDAPTIQDLEQL